MSPRRYGPRHSAPPGRTCLLLEAAANAGRRPWPTQRDLWARVQDFLRPGDVPIADQGTAFYGAAGLTLPDEARLIGQPLWGSIGWALPACSGRLAGRAGPARRADRR